MKQRILEQMSTLKDALREGTAMLERSGIEEASLDAWLLLEFVTGIDRTRYYMEPERAMEADWKERYADMLEKRSRRIPLQHITGVQEFMGLSFRVNEHVLIPRQDTEMLVETALEQLQPGMKVLDMCTGSGCIAISLWKFGKRLGRVDDVSEFTGVDISEKALETARENGTELEADVTFLESDLFAKVAGTYDMIVSNPPYIRTEVIRGLQEEVRCHDPYIALDGKEDGLYFYREIILKARKHLKEKGWLIFEIGHDQREDVTELMQAAGYCRVSAKKDLAGLDRVVMGMYNRA